jgi:hypothetical protein
MSLGRREEQDLRGEIENARRAANRHQLDDIYDEDEQLFVRREPRIRRKKNYETED